jgi:hypothetical protein
MIKIKSQEILNFKINKDNKDISKYNFKKYFFTIKNFNNSIVETLIKDKEISKEVNKIDKLKNNTSKKEHFKKEITAIKIWMTHQKLVV